ncbi:glutamate ABC transporter permease [Planomonospora parontospora subsp. parontospora]|uniref:Glutamate ABC transporter permease n=2 Tax=Planomonospora parontospora TaxID=58119 RepID=A0AA37BHC3_9ACTN|nr:amino acid ABC transporter permease [Planomonospora parontospora]GGK72183.1 glutamate ABC transporter permease [Planomonospora parontospora]GII09245.1 glutamate ABC transporter permease [Planomonospora parontospora subsp. parontospora]
MNDLIKYGPALAEGFLENVKLSVMCGVLSLILGTVLVSMRVSPTPVLRAAGTLYVNIVRNTPLTLVLAFSALGLSDTLGLTLSQTPSTNSFWLVVLGLSIYTASFVCEALRSGINTVPLGQAEAARAIGLTFLQSLRLIILPQAFRTVIAPLGSVIIAMIKNTTVAVAGGYLAESAFVMKDTFDDTGASIPIFLGLAVAFMAFTLPIGFLTGWLGRRLAVAR